MKTQRQWTWSGVVESIMGLIPLVGAAVIYAMLPVFFVWYLLDVHVF